MPAPPKLNWLTQQMISRSRQSWWQCRYRDGRVLSEWDTLQARLLIPVSGRAAGRTSRWEDIPKREMRGLYLLCPNGQAAALEANGDYLFFQLKVGVATMGQGTSCKAHLIGKVDGDDGRCICYAWEYEYGRLHRFEDNVTRMRYEQIGPLALDVVGLR